MSRRQVGVASAILSLAVIAGQVVSFSITGAIAGPGISVVTSFGGTAAPTKGKPKPAVSALISPTYVAYGPNGDEALVGGTHTRVYLIAGANEANEYHIETSTTGPTFGTLIAGDAYLVAGNGTKKIITNPGTSTPVTGGYSTEPAAVTNPIVPLSVAFDHAGNLLIGEKNTTTGQIAEAIQVVPKATGQCSGGCPYRLASFIAGDLYTVAATGLPNENLTVVVTYTFGVNSNGLVVDSTAQGNLIASTNGTVVFINEQATTINRYGLSLPAHQATVIAGNSTSTNAKGTCTSGGRTLHATGPTAPYLATAPAIALDRANNLYITDNITGTTQGCSWLLPATAGTVDNRSVNPGFLYSLTGPNSAASASSGAIAVTVSFPATAAVAVDLAGNVLLATAGSVPSLRVIAESTGTFYNQSMTQGHVYFIAGGPGAVRTTPGTAAGFKLSGPSALVLGSAGDILLCDGATPATQTLYQVTGAPATSVAKPVVTSITPTGGTIGGGAVVTIHGAHLAGTTAVLFGTAPATTVDNINATTITAVNPPHAAGLVSVSVTTAGGTGMLATGFTYHLAVPVLSGVTPPTGSLHGGRKVTLTGMNLNGTTSVLFGGVAAPATSIHVLGSTTVTVVTPAHSSTGRVAVSITAAGGTNTLTTGFTYVSGTPPGSPTISKVARPVTGGVIQGRQVTVTWAAPTATGGSPVTGYVVNSAPGSASCNTSALSCTVPGLTNGVTYAFSVRAISDAGTSAPSGVLHLAPGTVPAAPGVPTAVRGNASATVRWTAPTPTTSGFPITKYTATSTPGKKSCTWTGTGTYLCTVVGLTNGTSYSFTVTATNAVGTSVASAKTLYPAVPSGVVPGSPTNVVAFPGNGQATVIWTPPGTNGGAPITSYTVTSTPGQKKCTTAATYCTVTGITNGTSYAFSVAASNSYGAGLTSASSLRVTPTTRPTQGYWMVAADGGIFNFGLAQYYGSMGGTPLNAPVVGIALASTGQGYYEVASDGGIFAFGTAPFYGSMGGRPLNAPVVGMVVVPGGKGYYEVAADGGVFAFGTAPFYGSMGGVRLNRQVVGMQVEPTGMGYYEVASDGGIFAFNSTPLHPAAPFRGSMGGQVINAPIVGMVVTSGRKGYWEIGSDGGIFAFGTAPFLGSAGNRAITAAIVGAAQTPTGKGYWAVSADGSLYPFGTAQADGSMAGHPLSAPIVGLAASGA